MTAAARTLGAAAMLMLVGSFAHAQAVDDPLARALAVHLASATLDDALRAVERGAGVRLSYSSDLLPPSVRVTLDRERTSVAEALRDVLRGTGLGMAVAGSGHIVILPVPEWRATTGDEGASSQRPVSTTPVQLDRVLVMGTPAAGAPERQLTTAVNVVNAAAIKAGHSTTMAEVLTSAAPGVIAWDLGAAGPIAQVGSVRGSASFSANYLKTYVDGVELASPYMLFAIEPEIAERVEVIQGPQGSALYGSDAISGVAHVLTRKGTMGRGWRPHSEAAASAGMIETSFADAAAATHRESVAAEGGGPLASYRASLVYTDQGSYANGSGATHAGAHVAGRAITGSWSIEGMARASRINFASPVPPALDRVLGARAAPLIASSRADEEIRLYTAGATLIHEFSQRWRNSLVMGFDRNAGALVPQRNPASVADALLGASDEDARRGSLRYATMLRVATGEALNAKLTGGLDLSWLQRARSGPADVIGAPPGTPMSGRNIALYTDTVRNTGAFTQGEIDVGGALYVVGGIRGERNSSFGSGYGTAWSPMAGVSYVRRWDALTLKVRSAYGRGIRPPPPSARLALATREYRQVANANLAPESQSGTEGGFAVYVGSAFSLSATAFDQRADGLIQHVVPDPRVAPRAVQQQNVGEISNRGVEVALSAVARNMHAQASVATVDSRVQALSRFYTGELRRGDRVPEVPSWSGAASVAFVRGGLSVGVGLSCLGPWTGYDWISYYTALVNGVEVTSLRSYWIAYPSTARPNVVVSQAVGERLSWFARVDNLTNKQRDGRDNLQVLAGRTTRVGVSLAP